jgi:DNA-directed RNA polymerase beta subunit
VVETMGHFEKQRANKRRNTKSKTISKIDQIKTTQSVARKIAQEVSDSFDENDGIRSQTNKFTIEKIFLGKFPIMVQSEFCVLHEMTPENRFSVGECRNDKGGYFIIDGKEKVIVSQEKFADNVLYVRDYTTQTDEDIIDEAVNDDDDNDEKPTPEFLYSAQIVSVSENSSKFARTFSINII